MKINKFSLMTLFLTLSLLTSCSGSSDGVAPSDEPPPGSSDTDILITNMKYGSETQTVNGWTANFDDTDPVIPVTTVSGWKVEIKYE